MNQIWQYWPGILSDDMVENIKMVGDLAPVSEVGIGFDGNTANKDYRSSEVRWLHPSAPQHQFITGLLWDYGREANRNAFGFDIDCLPDIQYTKYHAVDGGHYGWHCDTFWANPTCYDRKVSIVVQLSDPDDYEGGDFLIDPQHPQLPADIIRQKGTIIAFPSFINHCVTPVTSGSRSSLVSWFQGPKFR